MKPLYDTATLLEQHPLPVKFPTLTGRYFMLVWWSHNEQHHVIVGRTRKGVIDTYLTIIRQRKHDRLSEWNDAEPRRFYEIEIVSPTRAMRVAYAKNQHRFEFEAFRSWLSTTADQLKPEMIPGVSPCPGYAGKEDEGDPWMVETHYDCKNCERGYTADWEQMYLKLREKYLPHSYHSRGAAKASVARLPRKGEKVFTVQDRHGHHSDGTIVQEVPKKHGGWFQEVKFFCHATELPLPEEVVAGRRAEDDYWEKVRKGREEEDRRLQDARESEHRRKVREVFSGL